MPSTWSKSSSLASITYFSSLKCFIKFSIIFVGILGILNNILYPFGDIKVSTKGTPPNPNTFAIISKSTNSSEFNFCISLIIISSDVVSSKLI